MLYSLVMVIQGIDTPCKHNEISHYQVERERDQVFFFILIFNPIQGSRVTHDRGLLNYVHDINIRR